MICMNSQGDFVRTAEEAVEAASVAGAIGLALLLLGTG